VTIINQTEDFPEKLRPGMQTNSVGTDFLVRNDPEKLKAIEEAAGAYVADWEKHLSGKVGMRRIIKIAAILFGASQHPEFIRVTKFGTENSFSIQSVRVPANV